MGEFVLLLLTVLFVLIAALTLLIGIFGNSLALIFVSIGFSIAAAVVLAVVSMAGKRKAAEAPAPAGGDVFTESPVATAPPSGPPVVEAPAEPTLVTATVAAGGVPIDGYESLRVNEIIPRLDSLTFEQLEDLAEHEEAGKNRASILSRIDQLLDEMEAAEAGGGTAAVVVEEVAAAGGFPIPDYDSRTEAEIVQLLSDLDADELEQVAEYEETHENRDRVLDGIDDRLDELEGLAPATPAKKKAAKKAAPATKKTASKAPVSKTVKKGAAVAKRPAAKKAAAAPARTAKAAVKKSTGVKKSAAVKKAGAAKKAAKRR